MNTNVERASVPKRPEGDYWDIPEIAALLRVVTHLNIGATFALLCWFAMATSITGGATAASLGAAKVAHQECHCELMLVPIPQGPRQIANTRTLPRS